MQNSFHTAADQAIELARQIRRERRLWHRMAKVYWELAFRLTRIVEYMPQRISTNKSQRVLNFGCGNHFSDRAVNSDLFGIHQFVLNKRRPDLYWTGTRNISALQEYFDSIVCEHVIEHVLPDDTFKMFRAMFAVLKQSGVIVISFPDVRRILSGQNPQDFSSPTVDLNSQAYRYGHTFLYDTDIVAELLRRAGFSQTEVSTYSEAPLQEFLNPDREPCSAYVVAVKT